MGEPFYTRRRRWATPLPMAIGYNRLSVTPTMCLDEYGEAVLGQRPKSMCKYEAAIATVFAKPPIVNGTSASKAVSV